MSRSWLPDTSSSKNSNSPPNTTSSTSAPRSGGLESWLDNYSARNPSTAPSAATPFLGSAFARPTVLPTSFTPPAPTPSPFGVNPMSPPFGSSTTSRRYTYDRYTAPSSRDNPFNNRYSFTGSSSDAFVGSLSDVERNRSLLNSYTPPSYHPTDLMQTPASIIGEYRPPTLNLPSVGERLELPYVSPPPSVLASLPASPAPSVVPVPKKNWSVCENLTRTHLDLCLKRLCTEFNWDFWVSNIDALNLINDPMTELTFRTLFCPAYEAFLILHARYEGYKFIDVIGLLAEPELPPLEEYQILVTGIIGMFADIRVGFYITGLEGPSWTEKDRKTMKVFLKALLEDGDIIKFVEARARSAGLTYPGGTGRYEERMRIARSQ